MRYVPRPSKYDLNPCDEGTHDEDGGTIPRLFHEPGSPEIMALEEEVAAELENEYSYIFQ